jgi:methyl-accepting chemotaxis protein
MEVNENVAQGSSASQKMAEDIANVKEGTAGLSTSSNEVKSNAENLSELGNRLAGLMGKFKV